MKIRKSLINLFQYFPQVLLLISVLTTNVFFPAVVIAEELESLPQEQVSEDILIDESEDILEEGISTNILEESIPEYTFEDGVYTVNSVQEKEYVYPDNELVKINFTSVTEDGNLVIKKVSLTDQEKEELNTTDDFGWDISSTMSNSSFTYDLTLPNTQGDEVEIMYSEDGEDYTITKNGEVSSNTIILRGLDHFTTFVVVNPLPEEYVEGSPDCPVINGDVCYSSIQEALNDTTLESGETILVEPGTYNENILISKDIKLLSSDGASETFILGSSGNPTISVNANSVTIDGFSISHNQISGINDIGVLLLTNTENAVIKNNNIYGNSIGIELLDSGSNEIEYNNFSLNAVGIYLEGFTDGTNSDVGSNGPFYSKSINNDIKNNNISNSFVMGGQGGDGIYVDAACEYNVFEDNIINNNESNGFYSWKANNNTLSGNSLFNNGDNGIQLMGSSNNIIINNDIYSNINNGVWIRSGALSSTANTITGNAIYTNNIGILLEDDYSTNNYDGVISGNTIEDNGIYNNTLAGSEARNTNPETLIDMRNNWWGDYYGPYDNLDDLSIPTKNLIGTGNTIIGAVWYDNWQNIDLTPPSLPVLEYPINDIYINDNTPLMQWADSSDGDKESGLAGYYYRIFYNCIDPQDSSTCSGVYPNNTGLWRTASQYQAGRTPDGVYFWQVKSKDIEGNESEWSDLEKFVIDTSRPTIPTGLHRRNIAGDIFSCGDVAQRQTMIPDWDDILNDPTFSHFEYSSFNANGSQGKDEMILNTSEFINNWVAPVDGTYGYTVRAVDMAGNKSDWATTSESYLDSCQITYDSVAPVVKLTSPIDNYYTNQTTVLQKWESEDTDIGYFEYRSCSNNPNIENCDTIYSTIRTTKSRTVSNNNISFWWQVRAVDMAGNIGPWSSANKLTIDTIAPEVKITSHVQGDILSGKNVNITGNIIDTNLSHYWFVITDSEGSKVAGPGVVYSSDNPTNILLTWDTTLVPDGEYTIKLEARDLANNKDLTKSLKWINVKVDNTAPTIEQMEDLILIEGDAFPTRSLQVTEALALDEICVEVEGNAICNTQTDLTYELSELIRLQLNDWFEIDLTTIDTQYLPIGTYDIDYYATDMAGNRSDTYTFTVEIQDNIPTVEILGANTLTQGTIPVTLSTSIVNGNAPFTFQWGGDCTGTSSTTEFTPSTVGNYTCTITLTDADGDVVGDTFDISVSVPEVLGTQTAKVDTTYIPTYTLGTGDGEEIIAQAPEDQVLGTEDDVQDLLGRINNCESTKKLSGYVYMDKNKNDQKDENETVLPEISVRIYIEYEGNEITVKEVTTDENGYWEAYVCPGDYMISVDGEDLPNNVEVGDVLSVTVSDTEEETLFNIAGVDQRNFWQKYWYILLIGGALTITTIYVILNNRKNQ